MESAKKSCVIISLRPAQPRPQQRGGGGVLRERASGVGEEARGAPRTLSLTSEGLFRRKSRYASVRTCGNPGRAARKRSSPHKPLDSRKGAAAANEGEAGALAQTRRGEEGRGGPDRIASRGGCRSCRMSRSSSAHSASISPRRRGRRPPHYRCCLPARSRASCGRRRAIDGGTRAAR